MSLQETLEKLIERLYAGFNLYAAITFQVWVVILSLYLLIDVFLQRVPPGVQRVVSIAYWLAATVIALSFTILYWRRYIARLAGVKKPRLPYWVKILIWLAIFAVVGLCEPLFEQAFGSRAAPPYTVLLAVTLGVTAMALIEGLSAGRMGPASAPAATLALLSAYYPLVANQLEDPWVYTYASILFSYSAATLLYIHAAIRRIT